MKVCITGASSSVAQKIIERLTPLHALTLLDLQFPPTRSVNLPTITGSILDRTVLKQAFRRQDAIIHTAIAPDNIATHAERWTVNAEGTLAVAEEAIAAGVTKFIYISSLSVLDGYDLSAREPGDETLDPRQRSFYGFTKYVGENIVKFHAEKYRMKSVTLRLVSVTADENETGDECDWRFNPIFRTSGRDVAQAVQLALEKDLAAVYEVFHISSANPNRFWSHEKATRMLGYRPVDGSRS
jgi:nucleoside-diphosphate-sugar epimerase